MDKMRIVFVASILLLVTVFSSSIPVLAKDKSTPRLGNGYRFGVFMVTCTDIEGINITSHIGGLSNLDITLTNKEFMIATIPFWGTTIIEDEVSLHITIGNFFGIIEKNPQGYIDIMGLCRNIAWEFA